MCEWLGDNAVGLIQIVIALGALYFAYQAYLGLMIQLNHSNDQEKIANEQRAFELYIKVMHELGQIYHLSKQTITKYKDVIIDYELLVKELVNSKVKDSEVEKIKNIVNGLKAQESEVKRSEIAIKDIFNDFKNSTNDDVEYMQNVLAKTIPLSSNLNRVSNTPDRMKVHLRKIKK